MFVNIWNAEKIGANSALQMQNTYLPVSHQMKVIWKFVSTP